MISAKVVQDSRCDLIDGKHRLTTMVLTYPRFIHSEVMTHRMLSKNAASSRAIPVAKMIAQVRDNPALPVFWGKNQPGMQAAEELGSTTKALTEAYWLSARDEAVVRAEQMLAVGTHKQIANRILEPWMWMVTIVSGTLDAYSNLYNLRIHPDAQPEFKVLAEAMLDAHKSSTPMTIKPGDWHLPFVGHETIMQAKARTEGDDAKTIDILRKVSAARCARVSYLNHDGSKPDIDKDIDLHDKLVVAPHASPFEHVATPRPGKWGNFTGFMQYRQVIPRENQPTYPGLEP